MLQFLVSHQHCSVQMNTNLYLKTVSLHKNIPLFCHDDLNWQLLITHMFPTLFQFIHFVIFKLRASELCPALKKDSKMCTYWFYMHHTYLSIDLALTEPLTTISILHTTPFTVILGSLMFQTICINQILSLGSGLFRILIQCLLPFSPHTCILILKWCS